MILCPDWRCDEVLKELKNQVTILKLFREAAKKVVFSVGLLREGKGRTTKKKNYFFLSSKKMMTPKLEGEGG